MPKVVLKMAMLLVVGAVIGWLAMSVQRKHRTAVSTTEAIEAQIAALDPVTRASVIGRLTKDAVDELRR